LAALARKKKERLPYRGGAEENCFETLGTELKREKERPSPAESRPPSIVSSTTGRERKRPYKKNLSEKKKRLERGKTEGATVKRGIRVRKDEFSNRSRIRVEAEEEQTRERGRRLTWGVKASARVIRGNRKAILNP